jgi:hypothetical protein
MADAPNMKWADAWQQLVYEHSPFRAADVADFQRLLRQLSELERLWLSSPELESYANELAGPVAARSDAGDSGPLSRIRHVVAIQLQLMEDAFYSLRLDRHANAPDNRGWMNLFRRWAASGTFRTHMRTLEKTVSRRFVSFYNHYIEGWKEDVPIPHPWDVRADSRKAKNKKGGAEAYAGATRDALESCRTGPYQGKGIFLDPGLVEAGQQDAHEPPRVKHGEHGTTEPSPSTAPASPPPGGEDSSKSTD